MTEEQIFVAFRDISLVIVVTEVLIVKAFFVYRLVKTLRDEDRRK